MRIRKILTNTIYVVGVQAVTMLLGLIKTFLIPKMLGVVGFGWWQYYLMFVGYVGLFALGFNDGFYLKYGSYDYNSLPQKKISGSFWLFVFVELLITFLFAISLIWIPDLDKRLILLAVAINIPIYGIKGFFIYVFQVTNRIKRYAIYSLIDRSLFLILTFVFYILKGRNFWILIGLDIATQLGVILLMMINCQSLIAIGNNVRSTFTEGLSELKDNIFIGVKLMIAIFTASLTGGIAKFFVEAYEGIENFSCFAFATTTTTVFILFINGLSTIAYPTLSRLDKTRFNVYFMDIDKVVSILSFGSLLLYPILKYLIQIYYTEYISCLDYYPVIVASIFITAKLSLVINTFYKVMRLENTMLWVNIFQCILLVLDLFVFYFISKSLLSVSLALLISRLCIYVYTMRYITEKLSISKHVDILIELLILAIFIISCYMKPWVGIIIYLFCFSMFILYNRSSLMCILQKYAKK